MVNLCAFFPLFCEPKTALRKLSLKKYYVDLYVLVQKDLQQRSKLKDHVTKYSSTMTLFIQKGKIYVCEFMVNFWKDIWETFESGCFC